MYPSYSPSFVDVIVTFWWSVVIRLKSVREFGRGCCGIRSAYPCDFLDNLFKAVENTPE